MLNSRFRFIFLALGLNFVLPCALMAEENCAPKPLLAVNEAPAYGKNAADFQVQTTSGTFALSSQWNACNSFVVFKTFTVPETHPLKNLSDQTNKLWRSRLDYLFQYSPPNVHYIFVSQNQDASQRDRDNAVIQSSFLNALNSMNEAQKAYWKEHVHIVNQDTTSLGSPWIGTIGVESFVIDPSQKVRALGVGAYSPLLNDADFLKLAMEAQYSQFLAAREKNLAIKPNVTIVKAFDKTPVQAGWAAFGGVIKEVDFPTEEEMKRFDKLSLDLELSCDKGVCLYDNNQYYYDRVIEVFLCADEADTQCDIELGRWVTPFGLGGRWVHESNALLALLAKGGKQRLRFHTVDKYNVSLNFRFEASGSTELRPFAYQEVYRGGKLGAAYNQRAAYEFTVPEGTKRVELVATTSGHGWGKDQANCAEFCVSDHEWVVNTSPALVQSLSGASNQLSCFFSAGLGVVPNQPGTWYFGRGGWCPGLEVKPVSWDITSSVNLNGINELRYRGLVNGQDYIPAPNPAGDANGYDAEINLRSYLVFYR